MKKSIPGLLLVMSQALSKGSLVTNSSNLIVPSNSITELGEDDILIQGIGTNVLMEKNTIKTSITMEYLFHLTRTLPFGLTFRYRVVRNEWLKRGDKRSNYSATPTLTISYMRSTVAKQAILISAFERINIYTAFIVKRLY